MSSLGLQVQRHGLGVGLQAPEQLGREHVWHYKSAGPSNNNESFNGERCGDSYIRIFVVLKGNQCRRILKSSAWQDKGDTRHRQ